jgi:hypothetical protein
VRHAGAGVTSGPAGRRTRGGSGRATYRFGNLFIHPSALDAAPVLRQLAPTLVLWCKQNYHDYLSPDSQVRSGRGWRAEGNEKEPASNFVPLPAYCARSPVRRYLQHHDHQLQRNTSPQSVVDRLLLRKRGSSSSGENGGAVRCEKIEKRTWSEFGLSKSLTRIPYKRIVEAAAHIFIKVEISQFQPNRLALHLPDGNGPGS